MVKRVEHQRMWQRMLSGRRLDLADPSPLDVEIEDIAHGLSRVARWNGQTSGPYPYSVAQHSVLVCDLYGYAHADFDTLELLMALLHDTPEYVIGDLISPFKSAVGDTYKAMETRLLEAIHVRYGLPPAVPKAVAKKIKTVDIVAAHCEAVFLAGFSKKEATQIFGSVDVALERYVLHRIETLSPDAAKRIFLERFCSLLADYERFSAGGR